MRFLLLCCGLLGVIATLHAAPIGIPTDGLDAPRQPQIAAASDGAVYLVFGSGNSIYASSARGTELAFGRAAKIAELPKLALGMRRGPRIASAGSNVVVTATSHDDGQLHCWRSADSGQSWSEQAPLNTVAKSAREGLHAMTSDGRSLIAVVWLDLRNSGMELWSRTSRDGGATWQPEIRVYASPDGHICECCVPSVAIGPRGEIAAMWRNWLGGSRDLWTSVSNDGGATFGEARKLGAGTWKLQGCPMDGGGLALAADGQLTTVWRRERAVFASSTSGDEAPLAADAAQPLVVSNGPKIARLWEHGGGLWLRVGEERAREFTNPARMAAAVSLKDGFAIVWEEAAGASTRLRAGWFDRQE